MEHNTHIYLSLPTYIGVTIGFTETVYSVRESDGQAVARVEVLSGELSGEVVVSFSTSDGSATGN